MHRPCMLRGTLLRIQQYNRYIFIIMKYIIMIKYRYKLCFAMNLPRVYSLGPGTTVSDGRTPGQN